LIKKIIMRFCSQIAAVFLISAGQALSLPSQAAVLIADPAFMEQAARDTSIGYVACLEEKAVHCANYRAAENIRRVMESGAGPEEGGSCRLYNAIAQGYGANLRGIGKPSPEQIQFVSYVQRELFKARIYIAKNCI
jgi:hypothetical protein